MARSLGCRLATWLFGTLASLTALLLLYRTGRDAARCYPAHHTHLPPSKPCAMHGYGWQLPGSKTLYASVWSSETRWGNELSRYWQGRAMARLGGLAFTAVGDFTHAWLRYLPLHVSAGSAPESCATFEAACDACVDWKYSHKCLGGWTTLGEEIIADTHTALQKYARRNRRALPVFDPQDAVIHNRCAKDVWFWHGEYGPSAFSLYHVLPANTTGTIYIVGTSSQERGPRAHAVYTGDGLFPPCEAKLRALQRALKLWYPGAKVVVTRGWDTFEDFVHMVYAPVLFKDSSSFGLWAGLANNNTVYSTKLPGGQYGLPDTFGNAHWVWSNATVLFPATARKLGLNTSDSVEDTQAIIKWLEEH